MTDDHAYLGHAPYPALDHPILGVIIDHALASHARGGSVREAILYAAVNAWSEGHIEGEDRCGGCSYRGPDPEAAQSLRDDAQTEVDARTTRHRHQRRQTTPAP